MPEVYNSEDKKPEKSVKKTDVSQDLHREDIENIQGHSHNPLSSFCFRPELVRFESQQSTEKIVLLLRRHPVTNVPWIALAVLLVLAPKLLEWFPLLSFLPERFQFVALLIWYLIVTAFILEEALSWYFNVNIITDERIIDIDFKNLIYRETSDAKIEYIQDVTDKLGGVVGTIFNFGRVEIQTAGTVPVIEFEDVPNPGRVLKIINELRREEEVEKIEGRVS